MHQGDVVENVDPHLAQVVAGGGVEKILVRRTEHVRFADDRGLHDDDVVHVAYGRTHKRVQGHDFGGAPQEFDVVKD